jgi:hypothetical protein
MERTSTSSDGQTRSSRRSHMVVRFASAESDENWDGVGHAR